MPIKHEFSRVIRDKNLFFNSWYALITCWAEYIGRAKQQNDTQQNYHAEHRVNKQNLRRTQAPVNT